MGKWFRLATAASLLTGGLTVGLSAFAAGPPQTAAVEETSAAAQTIVYIDGLRQEEAYVEGGRTMVQLTAFHDPEWGTYSYEPSTKTIVIRNSDDTMIIRLQPGEPEANVNGIRSQLDAPAAIRDGRTYVPLRFLSETLGGKVLYDAGAKEAIVRTPAGQAAYEKMMAGALPDARNAAIALPRIPLKDELQPLSEGSSTTYTFPQGEALRFTVEYKGLISYVEIDDDGLAEVKWQKDTWSSTGKYREVGTKPDNFAESVYFNYDPMVPEYSMYGTIESDGKDNQLGHYSVSEERQKRGDIINPIQDEKRTDARELPAPDSASK